MNNPENASGYAIEAWRLLASCLVGGWDECEQEGRPLNQLQRIDMLAYAFGSCEGTTEGMARQTDGNEFLEFLRRTGLVRPIGTDSGH